MTAEAKVLAVIAAYLIGMGASYGPFYHSNWCQPEMSPHIGDVLVQSCATLSSVVWPIASMQAISFALARPS